MNIMHEIYILSFTRLFGCLILGTVVFIIPHMLVQLRGSRTVKKGWNILLWLALAADIIIILGATLFTREGRAGQGYSLLPFYSYYLYFHGHAEMLRECIMNIAFFYPSGLLGGAVGKKKTHMLLCFLLLSVLIEICQGIFKLGYAEIDDVIHNTAGAGIGLLIMCLYEHRMKRETFADGLRNR